MCPVPHRPPSPHGSSGRCSSARSQPLGQLGKREKKKKKQSRGEERSFPPSWAASLCALQPSQGILSSKRKLRRESMGSSDQEKIICLPHARSLMASPPWGCSGAGSRAAAPWGLGADGARGRSGEDVPLPRALGLGEEEQQLPLLLCRAGDPKPLHPFPRPLCCCQHLVFPSTKHSLGESHRTFLVPEASEAAPASTAAGKKALQSNRQNLRESAGRLKQLREMLTLLLSLLSYFAVSPPVPHTPKSSADPRGQGAACRARAFPCQLGQGPTASPWLHAG